jgi:hypothetical protein
MHQNLGVDYAAIEAPLHRDDFIFGYDIGIFTAGAKVDERMTVTVINDELVAKDFSDTAFDGCRTVCLQFVDWTDLKQHHWLGPPAIHEPGTANAGRCTEGKKDKGRASHQTYRARYETRPKRFWSAVQMRVRSIHGKLL